MKLSGAIEDPDFCRLFLRVIDYTFLNSRETKYLIWKFYWKLTDNQIAKFDGRRVGHQAINLVINDTYRKIRKIGHDF
jgi:hypothetical protein